MRVYLEFLNSSNPRSLEGVNNSGRAYSAPSFGKLTVTGDVSNGIEADITSPF